MSAYLQIIESTRDEALEERIAAKLNESLDAGKRGKAKLQQEKWAEFVDLVALRSPEQVERLEKQKGLR